VAFKWALIKQLLQSLDIQKKNPSLLEAGNKRVTKDEIKIQPQMKTIFSVIKDVPCKKRFTRYLIKASAKTQERVSG